MKISIITVNLNNASGLKATLESVTKQTYRDFEHIIIDGGSNDESVDIIREYESIISNRKSIILKWVSEKDNGIYDAMNKGVEIASGIRVVNALNRSELVEDKNKGIKKATGEYLYFLNSGDCLASENVVAEMIAQMDGSAVIIGRVNQVLKGKIIGRTKLLAESDLSMYQMCLQGINHQSALIRRDVQCQYLYDTDLYLSADWKFFMQAIVRDNVNVKIVDRVFADYDCAGVSANNHERIMGERKKTLLTIVSPRIAKDYMAVLQHYYEVNRMQWLLQHPFWYRLYRGMTTLGRKIMSEWVKE